MSPQQFHRNDDVGAAEALYALGHYREALEALDTLPEEPEVLKARARSWVMLGEVDKAITCYENIVRRNPDDPAALIDFATFLTGQRRFREAVGVYDQAIRLDSRAAVAHSDRALALRLEGDGERALAGYDAALQIDATDGETWASKADLLIDLERYAEAVECLEKAGTAPTRRLDAAGWTMHASSFVHANAYDEAIHCYERALAQDPADSGALAGIASAFQSKGDLNAALKSYERMIDASPDNPKGWAQKGNVLADQGRLQEAYESYRKAVELDPSEKYSWSNISYCLRELGHPSEALEASETAIGLDAGFSYAWEAKGAALLKLKRDHEAMDAYKRALTLNEALVWSNNNLGWLLANRFDKYEEALPYYDRAIELDPTEATPITNKAEALAGLKRVSEAESLLRSALESVKAEEKGEILTQLGVLFSDERKDAARALELFEESAAASVVDDDLTLNIAEMLIRLNRLEEGRARAALVLQNAGEQGRLGSAAALLIYVAHVLNGNVEKANKAFNDFVQRVIKSAEAGVRDEPKLIHYDGLIDTLVKGSTGLAEKLALLMAIDLEWGRLVSPGASMLPEFASVIKPPATADPKMLKDTGAADSVPDPVENEPNSRND